MTDFSPEFVAEIRAARDWNTGALKNARTDLERLESELADRYAYVRKLVDSRESYDRLIALMESA